MEKNKYNLEKIGIYLSSTIAFLTLIFYITDMKERIAKIEVKMEYLEKIGEKTLSFQFTQ